MSFAKLQPSLTASDLNIPSSLRPLSGIEASAEVLTRTGYKSAAQLSTGDDVITRDKGLQPIKDLTRKTQRSRMVCFAAEALGADRPDQDLRIPSRQLLLIRDWRAQALFGRHEAQIQAAALIDDHYITDAGMQQIDCVQIWLNTPSVLYVRGMEVLCAHEFDAALQPQL